MNQGSKWFSLLFFLIINFSFSQNKEIELRKKIETSKDSVLISAYISLAKYYFRTTGKGDSLIFYEKKALELSQSLDSEVQEMVSLMIKGVGHLVKEDYDEAEHCFKQGLKKASDLNNISEKVDFYNKLGTLYQNKNNYFLAIEQFLGAAKSSYEIKDYESEANAYYGISLVYMAQREYKKQLEYIDKAVNIIEANNVKDELLKTLIYNYAAEQHMESSKKNIYPKHANLAKVYAKKALKIADKNNFNYTKPVSLGVLSEYGF